MGALECYQFPCRDDNYGVLVHDPASRQTASIDAPEFAAVDSALKQKNWTLTHIFTTHKHHDHVEGNLQLKEKHGCLIIGPSDEEDNIPGIDRAYTLDDTFTFADEIVEVIGTPGHTLGQVAYHLPQSQVVFAADALFALGCGRIFEGTPEQMWTALARLAALPPETTVYAGHEYTLSNAKFAATIEPENEDLLQRCEEIVKLRSENLPTLPTTIGLELATNPFLRPDSTAIRARLGMQSASDVEVFAEIRKRKDNF